MQIGFQYGNDVLNLNLPDDSIVYESKYKNSGKSAGELLQDSMEDPVDSMKLTGLLQHKRPGNVVIVVSDITRPIPYHEFMPQLLTLIEGSGVPREEIEVLVATGMHRASTREEHLRMFGEFVVSNYTISDHDCKDANNLEQLSELSWSGSSVRLNKKYVRAGFRIVTGLVEPHFMAGFSGGRKAICPGLVDLATIQKFHGFAFLSHPNAISSVMVDNPCNLENTSVANLCLPDFSINVILDNHKKINSIVSGELFASHLKSVNYVKSACCPPVTEIADVALTSSGGYPLDATFYQCVKGLVNSLPAVREEGEILAFGSCMEGIGSPEYTSIMEKYSGDLHRFIEDIKENKFFIKDQWQLQMQIRVIKKTGMSNLHFYTSAIPQATLSRLSVTPHEVAASDLEQAIQTHIDQLVAAKKRIAVFPEGPYCSPVSR